MSPLSSARIRCPDETWAAFRLACGSTSVACHLGAMVEGEVARWRLERSSAEATDASFRRGASVDGGLFATEHEVDAGEDESQFALGQMADAV